MHAGQFTGQDFEALDLFALQSGPGSSRSLSGERCSLNWGFLKKGLRAPLKVLGFIQGRFRVDPYKNSMALSITLESLQKGFGVDTCKAGVELMFIRITWLIL